MYQTNENKRNTGLWVLAIVCVAIIVLSLAGGAAYTAVREAHFSAAKANIGHIEAVMLLAESKAEKDGLGAAPEVYDNVIKSYGDGQAQSLTAYEKYILAFMLDSFGPKRDFDFAVTRYQDASGAYMQVYYFPVAGRTDMKRDRYYVLNGNNVSEKNP